MRALILCIALTILSALPALAADVLVLQSGNGPAYRDAVRGFQEVYQGTTRTILLSDYTEVDVVRLVKEEQPRLVLAVGDPALTASKKVRQVPVVAIMALSVTLQRPPGSNIHAISMMANPSRYLDLFAGMGARRVGVLYDPSRSGLYLKRAISTAAGAGISLVAREVRTPRQTIEQLASLEGAVDAVWMLPDPTAVTAETVEAYFTFSMKRQLPVVSFSERHLSGGAAAAIDSDKTDMGRQAGELALSMLHNGAGSAGSVVDPRTTRLTTNKSVLQKLGQTLR